MARACAVLLLTVFAASTPARAEIYRWVDEHGVMHLDDTLANVPESSRSDAKVFQSRVRAEPAGEASTHGPTQAAFAAAVARELGLVTSESQDPVSVLYVVGVYPSVGWNPAAALTPAVVDEVTRSVRAAARARRLRQAEAIAEATVLRIAAGLGVPGPSPAALPEPAPPQPPTVVVAPNIVVESPPPSVVVHTVERVREPVWTGWGWTPGFGVPYAPIPGAPLGPIPDRITPLSNPAGHLRGPAVPPRPRPQPFRRTSVF